VGRAVSEKLDFVNVRRGRDGVVRHWYFRRNGRRWRLPGDPSTNDEAAAEYSGCARKRAATTNPM